MSPFFAFLSTFGLLTISNTFMTFAWYGHLKFKSHPLYVVIICSWLIAFFEYCFQIPANRFGSNYFEPVKLKAMQESITMIVFVIFATFYLDEPIKLHHYIGLTMIAIGACIVFHR